MDKDEKFTKGNFFYNILKHKIDCSFLGTRLVSNILQLLARLGSIVLAILTLWVGFALVQQGELDIQTGYYNTSLVRIAVLVGILTLQM